MKKRLGIIILVLAILTSSCDKILLKEQENMISLEENLQPPPLLNDGWEVSSLEAEGIHASAIQYLIKRLQNESFNIHSLLIVRNNKLVTEAYFNGWHRERKKTLRSATKSVMSCLIGIALDKKYIHSTQQPIFDFFPAYTSLKNKQNQEIRLEHVLTMTSGLQWDQSNHQFENQLNDEGAMVRSSDAIQFVLEKPVVNKIGEQFLYNSGNTQLLAGVIHQATGMQADIFAEKFLFGPLGIKDYVWGKQNDHYPNASFGLFLRPRDMAKFGQVWLDQGRWQGQQLVPKEWIKQSTTTYIGKEEEHNGYGYQWWISQWNIKNQIIRSFQAVGNGGQVIMVFPSLNSVVVFTGGNYDSETRTTQLTQNIILPALLDK